MVAAVSGPSGGSPGSGGLGAGPGASLAKTGAPGGAVALRPGGAAAVAAGRVPGARSDEVVTRWQASDVPATG